MITRRTWTFWLLVTLTPALMGAECGESLVKDPGFDGWCGDMLCAWQVHEGRVAKAPTWHDRDLGVELVGPSVQLSQRGEYGGNRPGCLSFDLLSDVDGRASVVLGLDFGDDGSVEFEQVVPNGPWRELSYKVTAPTWYQVIRFSIRKRGEGRAVLARVRVGADVDCAGPPLSTGARPGAAPCEAAGQCAGGVCRQEGADETIALRPADAPATFCGGCNADADCAGGSVCGLAHGGEPRFFRQCVPAGARVLGERCASARECATGVCCGGVCSACCAGGSACSGGGACVEAAFPELVRRPWLCAPADAVGAPCLRAVDCAGGSCAGAAALSVCAGDGRTCDEAHPCLDFGGLLHNPCVALGVAGGQCR